MAKRKRTTPPPDDAPARVGFTQPPAKDLTPDDPTFTDHGGTPPPKEQRLKITEEQHRIAKTACALLGATNEQLAKLFGVHVTTVEYWLRENSSFFKTVRDGKDQYNARKVESALLQRALGYEYDEVTREHVEIKNGTRMEPLPGVKVKVVRKKVLPDTTAIIFFLINRSRQSGRWQNSQNVKVTGQIDQGVVFDFTGVSETDLVALRGVLSKLPDQTPNREKAAQLEPAEPLDTLEGGG